MKQRNRILLKVSVFFTLLVVAWFFVFQAIAQDDNELSWFKIYYTKAQKMQALRIIKELGSRAPAYSPDDLHPHFMARISNQEAWDYYHKGFQVEEAPGYDPLNTRSLLIEERAIPGYPCYRTVAETYQTAEEITATHPNLATLADIGDS